ncbi:MAG: glycosyltransferase [Pseudomonadota bacterium]|nr:glycosyltransferase [Pseudomonadota bacterium]
MTISVIQFSVVIPNYNNGATLARAIESVLAQDYPAHEILVIDDGSHDDSSAVAAQFGDRVRYVYQDNAGVSAARNRGAQLANGNWLAFLDADDIYLPNRLSAHASWLARDPGLDFLFGDQDQRSPDDRHQIMAIGASKAGRALVARHPGQAELPLDPPDFEALIADGFSEIRTLSIPRTTFLALGGFPTEHKIGEDLHFFIRLFLRSRRGGVVNLPLAVYYIYAGSALRKDPIGAQRGFVAALESLKGEIAGAGLPIRRGWRAKLRQGRLSLAYMHLRQREKVMALRCVLPLLWQAPSLHSVRDVLSIARGL